MFHLPALLAASGMLPHHPASGILPYFTAYKAALVQKIYFADKRRGIKWSNMIQVRGFKVFLLRQGEEGLGKKNQARIFKQLLKYGDIG